MQALAAPDPYEKLRMSGGAVYCVLDEQAGLVHGARPGRLVGTICRYAPYL
jgi:hypothetical protein